MALLIIFVTLALGCFVYWLQMDSYKDGYRDGKRNGRSDALTDLGLTHVDDPL